MKAGNKLAQLSLLMGLIASEPSPRNSRSRAEIARTVASSPSFPLNLQNSTSSTPPPNPRCNPTAEDRQSAHLIWLNVNEQGRLVTHDTRDLSPHMQRRLIHRLLRPVDIERSLENFNIENQRVIDTFSNNAFANILYPEYLGLFHNQIESHCFDLIDISVHSHLTEPADSHPSRHSLRRMQMSMEQTIRHELLHDIYTNGLTQNERAEFDEIIETVFAFAQLGNIDWFISIHAKQPHQKGVLEADAINATRSLTPESDEDNFILLNRYNIEGSFRPFIHHFIEQETGTRANEYPELNLEPNITDSIEDLLLWYCKFRVTIMATIQDYPAEQQVNLANEIYVRIVESRIIFPGLAPYYQEFIAHRRFNQLRENTFFHGPYSENPYLSSSRNFQNFALPVIQRFNQFLAQYFPPHH